MADFLTFNKGSVPMVPRGKRKKMTFRYQMISHERYRS